MRVCLLFVSLCVSTGTAASAAESVKAELGKESAWTGEAVPLVITLYSVGPFSGTAAFDLPELPQTVFTRGGRPIVGSEEIGDEMYLTQRHEFKVYTQRTGRIVVPPFRVRYSSKKTFTSEPEPRQDMTGELIFESKRPPGTESMGLVISASNLQVQQSWNPEPGAKITAGDVIIRTITRKAEGTTAMMLTPVSEQAPDGVQVYVDTPEVQDRTERGDSTAERIDTLKYQLQTPGDFMLPEVTFSWWDPDSKEVKSQTLPGLQVEVAAATSPTAAKELREAEASDPQRLAVIVFIIGCLLWVVYKPVRRGLESWRAKHNSPLAVARRELKAACAANDSTKVYSAMMAWLQTSQTSENHNETSLVLTQQPLKDHWDSLSRSLFATEAVPVSWNGQEFWNAFVSTQQRVSHVKRKQSNKLPSLNPAADPARTPA